MGRLEMFRVWQHLQLVGSAAVATIVFGVLMGVVAYLVAWMRTPILWVADLMQTIPVLALLGFIMLVFGPGATTVITGIVLYSLLPVIRNTYVGLSGVSPAIKEAAQGMGMTKLQALLRVELPLAAPIIFAGVRIAVVTAIGIAVFGAVAGGGGLGIVLNRAILTRDMNTLAIATAILMAMAISFYAAMSVIENYLRKRKGAKS